MLASALFHRNVSLSYLRDESREGNAQGVPKRAGIYRDELDKKQAPAGKLCRDEEKRSSRRRQGNKIIANGCKEEEEEEEEGKEGMRVKVTMTKEEARRLLSKCKEGGILEFKDTARHLAHIPTNRVRVVPSSGRCHAPDHPHPLQTIPE